jgi:CO/xanthine dehydrogenase Mo-binding subunit
VADSTITPRTAGVSIPTSCGSIFFGVMVIHRLIRYNKPLSLPGAWRSGETRAWIGAGAPIGGGDSGSESITDSGGRRMATYQVIGKPMRRVDGAEKATGHARYAADVSLPGTLWGKSLHSTYAHARIVRIDTTAARKVPGVHAVITGADVQGGLWGRAVKDVPVLASDRVRFFGERVAAVAAADEDIAERALDLIEIEYEELPAVFDPLAALKDDAPILHPGFNTYVGFPQKMEKPSNAYHKTSFEKGDPERGFAEADLVIENTYVTQRVHQGYIEPQAVLVNIDDSGRVHVWACSKVPYNTRESLATAAAIPEEQVLFHHVHIGGDFGGKGNARNTPICYFLAKATGRPVRMVSDYTEEFFAGNPRHAVDIRLKTGVKRDGTLTAHEVQYTVNSGAYAAFKPAGIIGGYNQAAGPYRVPNCRIESTFVYTNTIPCGFMRAPGEPQAVFALESHIDEIARQLGIDPLAFRLKNLIVDGDETGSGERFEHVRVHETLQAVAEAAGYHQPKPSLVGRGIAIGDRPAGGGQATAAITLRPDGSVILGTPIFDQGTGTYTTLCQVVAEELRVPLERIQVEIWNTDAIPFDSGVAGSRATRINTIVAYEAVQETKRELLRLAARALGWPEEVLAFSGDEIRRTDREAAIRWIDLLARAGEPVTGRAHIEERGRAHITSFAAQVAEVSVDPETGQVKLLRFITAHDVGQIVNPIGHQGQIDGAIMQGVGYALMEELQVEDGRVTNLSFGDYKLPTVRDAPPLTTVLVEAASGVGPYQIKGIGESPLTPVAPAIANAVADAVGVRIRDLPITAEKVYRALQDNDHR